MKHLKYTKNILTCWCTDRENVLDHRPADLPSSQTDGEKYNTFSCQLSDPVSDVHRCYHLKLKIQRTQSFLCLI